MPGVAHDALGPHAPLGGGDTDPIPVPIPLPAECDIVIEPPGELSD